MKLLNFLNPTVLDKATEKANKREKNQTSKFRARHFALQDGRAWNPLQKYPVNKGCWCGSGTKAKKCCQPYLAETCSEVFAKNLLQEWDLLLCGKKILPACPREDSNE